MNEERHTHWNNLPVEIEFAELQSSSTECPQFAQIEEIPPESVGKSTQQDSEVIMAVSISFLTFLLVFQEVYTYFLNLKNCLVLHFHKIKIFCIQN